MPINAQIIVAPAYWAAYLIDRDPRRVQQHDGQRAAHTLQRIDAWLIQLRPLAIKDLVRPSGAYHTAIHDCAGYVDDPVSDMTYSDYLAMRVTKQTHP